MSAQIKRHTTEAGQETGDAGEVVHRMHRAAVGPTSRICHWLSHVLDMNIQPLNFMTVLYDGSVLCKLANVIQAAAEDCGKSPECSKIPVVITRWDNKRQAYENIVNFRNWCMKWGIQESRLLKVQDLLFAGREESVVSTMLEMIELASKFGMRISDVPDSSLSPMHRPVRH